MVWPHHLTTHAVTSRIQVFEVISYVLPKMGRFVMALIFVYYIFSVIGMMGKLAMWPIATFGCGAAC